jgi:hypothetical protein
MHGKTTIKKVLNSFQYHCEKKIKLKKIHHIYITNIRLFVILLKISLFREGKEFYKYVM